MFKVDFIVAGVEKSATTWLYNILESQNSIVMSSVKEVHFFNSILSMGEKNTNYSNGFNWYHDFFDFSDDRVSGEITPIYFCDPDAPKRMFEYNKNLKIFLFLRNPVDRSWSHYWMGVNKGYIKRSFFEEVTDVDSIINIRSHYGRALENILCYFDLSQICFLDFDKVKSDPESILNEISGFLEIEPIQLSSVDEKSRFKSSGYKYPLLSTMGPSIIRAMRKSRIGFYVADKFKSLGFFDFIKRSNMTSFEYQVMDPLVREKTYKIFSKDIDKLEFLSGQKFDLWRL